MEDPTVGNGNSGQGGASQDAEAPRAIEPATVDNKGRLKLPASFFEYLKKLGVNKVFVTTVDLEQVRVYPTSLWNANEKYAESATDLKEEAEDILYLARHYGGDSDVDSQGRVLIPTELRRELKMESAPVWVDCQRNGRINVATHEAHEARLHRAKADMIAKKKVVEKDGFK